MRRSGDWTIERHAGATSVGQKSLPRIGGASGLQFPVAVHSATRELAELPASDGPAVFTANDINNPDGFVAMLRNYADNFLEPRNLTAAAAEYRELGQELYDADNPTDYEELSDLAESNIRLSVAQHGYRLHNNDGDTMSVHDPSAAPSVAAESAHVGTQITQTGPTVTRSESPSVDVHPLKYGQVDTYPVRCAPTTPGQDPRGMYGQTPTPANRPTL